mgnify:CR=1 FL=1
MACTHTTSKYASNQSNKNMVYNVIHILHFIHATVLFVWMEGWMDMQEKHLRYTNWNLTIKCNV